jgi:YfiH family protein
MSDLPQPSDGFRWVQAGRHAALVCEPLETIAAHLFATRHWTLGQSRIDGDDQRAWAEVAAALGVDAARLARVKQVHGAHVVTGSEALRHRCEADALATVDADTALAVQTADCVPILVADRRTGAAAAIHAGWRGLAARIPEQAIAALIQSFAAVPRDLVAAIGPAIGACCYEVGTDVVNRFIAAGFPEDQLQDWFTRTAPASNRNPPMESVQVAGRPGHWFFNGPRCAQQMLERSGLEPDMIFNAQLCTASHPGVFCSYRRDGPPAGRMAAAIRTAPQP